MPTRYNQCIDNNILKEKAFLYCFPKNNLTRFMPYRYNSAKHRISIKSNVIFQEVTMRQLLIAFTLFLVSSTTLTYGADLKLKIFFTDNPNIDQSQGAFLLKNSIKVAKKNQLVHAGFIVSGYQLD